MKSRLALSILAVAASGLLSVTSFAAGFPSFKAPRNPEVMTYNCYIGADVSPILTAATQEDLILDVTAAFAQVQASDVPFRMSHIAASISASALDIVALEEVDQLSIDGTVELDYLQLILDALQAKGAHYAAIVVQNNLDATAPMLDQNQNVAFLRLLDRDVLLARTDLPAADLTLPSVTAQTFANLLTIPSPVLGNFTIPRGWISADVTMRGKTFRFVTGHLESFYAGINVLQGLELLSGPANTSMPVVMAADFNSGPNDPFGFTGTYSNIIADGFSDTWTVLQPHLVGNTCCQSPDLLNSSSDLSERIDQIFFDGGIKPISVQKIGHELFKPSEPLWASDHVGVQAVLKLPSRRMEQ